MSEVVQLFGARAGAYASFRPHYPDALFDWLADRAPRRRHALDIACGNGQASRPLAKRFERVLGCDASVEQLQAADVDGVALFAADAARQPLADGSLDLIVVAQALHWFATPAFFAETRRLLKPGGLFVAWCYGLMRIDARTDALVDHLYHVTLDGCWPEGRASIEAGYRDLQPPFPRLEVPEFSMQAHWSLEQLAGYLRTWSAVQRWERQHGHDPITDLMPALRQAWGNDRHQRRVSWPLHFLAGYPAG
ncbi:MULTISPECIES: class I SAM-dependent methyltransferase [Pseudomonas]|uniref:class I SAM-dependent methyltransferase n=1 Tax=Pseudomonas TaxID=286 RepID=UPI00249C8A8F|nr:MULTISPECIES: class I SAM-dependent methyltransferase [Pseudomonas]